MQLDGVIGNPQKSQSKKHILKKTASTPKSIIKSRANVDMFGGRPKEQITGTSTLKITLNVTN